MLSEEEVSAQRYRQDIGKTLYVDGYALTQIPVKNHQDSQVCIFVEVNIYVSLHYGGETYCFWPVHLSMCPSRHLSAQLL